ncbi:MAG: DUF1570 domain-containing protein [Pirellulales bacterium]
MFVYTPRHAIRRSGLPRSLLLVALGWSVLSSPFSAAGREAATLAGRWPMETVVCEDGRVFHGLIDSRENGWLRMIEVARPPGEPMHLVIFPIRRAAVAEIQRLPPEQREELRARIDRFRRRAAIEARQEAAIELEEFTRWDLPLRAYRHQYFTLAGTIDADSLRRIAVKTDQLFTALRQLLPPRVEPDDRPTLVVFRSSEQYRSVLREYEVSIENPACYLRSERLVLLGSDLARHEAALAEVRRRHRRLQEQLERLQESIERQLAARRTQLQQQRYPRGVVRRLLLRQRHRLEEPLEQKRRQLERSGRENRRAFAAVTRELFRRLRHESVHAYVETYVYPGDRRRLPPWMAEGLAVMFEIAQVDSDTLRVDAPNRRALATLRADLESASPLPLAEVLRADAEAFLITDDARAGAVRYYAAAWGLVYYLAFDLGLLDRGHLDRYLAAEKGDSPVEQFEQFTGQPLERFEPAWRAAMLRLKRR